MPLGSNKYRSSSSEFTDLLLKGALDMPKYI